MVSRLFFWWVPLDSARASRHMATIWTSKILASFLLALRKERAMLGFLLGFPYRMKFKIIVSFICFYFRQLNASLPAFGGIPSDPSVVGPPVEMVICRTVKRPKAYSAKEFLTTRNLQPSKMISPPAEEMVFKVRL